MYYSHKKIKKIFSEIRKQHSYRCLLTYQKLNVGWVKKSTMEKMFSFQQKQKKKEENYMKIKFKKEMKDFFHT